MTDGGLPPAFLERARAAHQDAFVPVPTRDAATVALVRDGDAGLEVYLLRRVRAMAFAGGMHVFPGGAVDPADAAADLGWAGPSPQEWGAAFAVDPQLARSLVCAAVRETFEESGVMLAGRTESDVLADVSGDDWELERTALERRDHSLSALFARRELVLRSDLLRPLAHWVTPVAEAKRFDTRFFLARLPAGQLTRAAGGEADRRMWVRPADALAGDLTLMPPTRAVLSDLAGYDTVEAALAAPRTITRVLPQLRVGPDDRLLLLLPGDDGYEPDPADPVQRPTPR